MNQRPIHSIPTALSAHDRRRIICAAVFFLSVAALFFLARGTHAGFNHDRLNRAQLNRAQLNRVGTTNIYREESAKNYELNFGGYLVCRTDVEESAAIVAAAHAQKRSSRRQQPRVSAKVLYAENCLSCHGADGRGQTPMGRALAATNLADASWWKRERVGEKRLAASIRDGRSKMPAFGKTLSREEIAALVAYVKTFNGK
jgi:mono/diheme cytochrome c family protein